MTLGPLPQDEIQAEGQIEYRKEKQQLLPVYKKGDRYPLLGAIVGIIIGLVMFTITRLPWVLIVGIIGGGLLGTTFGSLTGSIIKKFQRPKKDNLKYF